MLKREGEGEISAMGVSLTLCTVVCSCSLVYKYVTKPGKSVTARHILVKTETECLDLKAKIESNQMTFAEAAEGYSTCPSGKRGGQLGTFGPGMMVPAFDAVCFKPSTPLKTTIGPVQTHFGFHLIYMEDRTLDTKSDKTD